MKKTQGGLLVALLPVPAEVSIHPVVAAIDLTDAAVARLRGRISGFDEYAATTPGTSLIRVRSDDVRLYAQVDPGRRRQSRWDAVDFQIELARAGLGRRSGLPVDDRTHLIQLPEPDKWNLVGARSLPEDLALTLESQQLELYRTMESRRILADLGYRKNPERHERTYVRDQIKTVRGRTRSCWLLKPADGRRFLRTPAIGALDLRRWRRELRDRRRAAPTGGFGEAHYASVLNHMIHNDDSDDVTTAVEDQIVG